MLRVRLSAVNRVGKTVHSSLLAMYKLENLVVLVGSVLPRFNNVTNVNHSLEDKNERFVWIQKHQRLLHFSVGNSFQFLFQPLSLSTNVPPAVSNVRIHRLRRLPTKPSLHLRQRCCRILQEPRCPVQPEEMRIVTVSHDTFHNVDGCAR